jgi:hypothetical protein
MSIEKFSTTVFTQNGGAHSKLCSWTAQPHAQTHSVQITNLNATRRATTNLTHPVQPRKFQQKFENQRRGHPEALKNSGPT